jgi:tetrahydromethanopterin S-methyltransferase subunit B
MQLELIQSIDAERDSLAVHVDICAQRYSQLIAKLDSVDERFDRLETVVQEIRDRVMNDRTDTLKTYLTWAGVIIAGLISITGYLLATFVIGH